MKTAPIEDRAPARNPPAVSVWACAWPGLLVATVFLLPFLNKAFLVDDAYFLTMARQIVSHPLHPMGFVFCGSPYFPCTTAYLQTPGNALMGYALVPTVLGGAHEWMAHLTQLVFAWIAILAMTSLVLRLGWNRRHAIAGALLLVVIPPFLPMASTAMPDVLAATLAVVAIERLAAWKVEMKWHQGLIAAVALGLAGFARSHLALLIPLGAFFLLDSTNPREIFEQLRRRLWLWAPVAAGAVLLFAIILATRERSLGLDPPTSVRGMENIAPNLRSYLLYFVFPLPLAACWMANRWKTRRWMRVVFFLIAGGVAAFVLPRTRWYDTFMAVLGLGTLGDLLFEAWQKKLEHTRVFLLLWLLIPLPIIYYNHLPIKYLLPTIPAVILICFGLMEVFSFRAARTAGTGWIVASALYSLLILRSDAEFANFGRSALDHLIRPHVSAGEKVWFPEQFSVFWYAPLDGAHLSPLGGTQPSPGDLFVVGQYEGSDVTLKRFPNRTLVETESHIYRFGRTMGEGMGLYSNRSGGNWLWGLGKGQPTRYELWRIN